MELPLARAPLGSDAGRRSLAAQGPEAARARNRTQAHAPPFGPRGEVEVDRAAVAHDTYTAHQMVEHDDVNVLCLGGRVIGPESEHLQHLIDGLGQNPKYFFCVAIDHRRKGGHAH